MKRICAVMVLLALGSRAAFGFALLGPFNEPYQVEVIGYHITPTSAGFGDEGNITDIGAPKNFTQGYRWNVPTLIYAFDSSFSTYFGTDGQNAVDSAFAVFNSLSPVSSYTSNLAEWPLSASRYNFTAANLGLIDLKSQVMETVIEELGLAQPVRWVYAIHDRYTGSGLTCGNYNYFIIQRNYDTIASSLTTTPYSKYVNGTLFGYSILDLCAITPPPFGALQADAVEYTADPTKFYLNVPLAEQYSASGLYFNGLTRDDVMGLRYLYSATNVYTEAANAGSVLYVTNFSSPQVIVSQDYGTFLAQALTNGPAALQALYPGLVILSNFNYFGPFVTTNSSLFVSNVIGGYAGEQTIANAINYTTNYGNLYRYTFGNLVVRNTYLGRPQVTETITFGPIIGGYAGQYGLRTNFTFSSLPGTNGDFFLIPSNLCGSGYYFLTNYPPIPQFINTTNFLSILGNTVSNIGSTITLFSQTVTSTTNYSLVVDPILCVTNAIELRQGIEKISFVRQDYDSVIGTAWTPTTNIYNLTAITNNAPVRETLMRVVTQPDFLITAGDLTAGPNQPLAANSIVRSFPNFNFSGSTNGGVYGPGTLGPSTSGNFPLAITFNDVGPFYINASPFFNAGPYEVSTDANSIFVFAYGSFDGTTNAPEVYPNTVSIANLEAQIYFQITTSLLPNASLSTNTSYSLQLQAQSSVSPPFTWSLATNSAALPAGLSLSPSGLISGVPTAAQGTYDFTVQAKDSTARTTTKALFVVIVP